MQFRRLKKLSMNPARLVLVPMALAVFLAAGPALSQAPAAPGAPHPESPAAAPAADSPARAADPAEAAAVPGTEEAAPGPETPAEPAPLEPRPKVEAGQAPEAPGHGEGAHAEEGHAHQRRWLPPLWAIAGFVGMLLSIAVIPLASPHWWEHNKNKAIVSAIWGVPLGMYLIANDYLALVHSLHEYEQFIILLLSLFVISGGIWLSGDVRSMPRNNVIFLALGSVLASFIGTTGAAMLLIRPLLTSNSERKHVTHTVIFFIFIVANIGGSLTPLGDPPLFLGYLRGVEFTWTFKLWKFWLPTVAWLLTLYFMIDTVIYNRYETEEAKEWDETQIVPLKLRGAHNFLFLIGVVLSIYFYPAMRHFVEHNLNVSESVAEYLPIRECLMLLMALLSWVTTKMEYRKAQNFTWNPILEVAILFLAIFVTMVPALILLDDWGPRSPIQKPWHFFWVAGGLSSFLDNAPTYLTFLSLGLGQCKEGCPFQYTLATGQTINELTLMAIAVGAVFMGSNTYIGNAPNFMVKSIAEENKIKMPSFFGYMAWSIGILIPTFIVITLIAFR